MRIERIIPFPDPGMLHPFFSRSSVSPMKIHPVRSLVCALAAVVALLAAESRVQAETLSMIFDSTASNTTVSYSLNGTAASTIPGPYYWNSVPPPNSGPPAFATMCIELTQGIPGGAVAFNVVAPSSSPTINDTAKGDALVALYGNFYNTAWNDPTTANTDTSYRAFQLAIWEIVTDGAGSAANRLTTGLFRSNDTAAAIAQAMLTTTLNDIAGGQTNFTTRFPNEELVALVSESAQDQLLLRTQKTTIVSIVPTPPGLVLAGMGLVVLLGRARWRQRSSMTAC